MCGCTVLYFTVLYCTVMYCIAALCCTVLTCCTALVYLQEKSGEEAAKAAWSAAAVDLPSLLPSFAREQADVDKVLEKHSAQYLVA